MRKSKQKPLKVMAAGDVAKLLGISYQYLDRIAKEGKLPYQQTSSGKIFLEEDVLAFKREREKKAETDPRIKREQ
ncbi:MAG: hypothetical protein WCV62_01205 [Candidatus Peribacteraceae bacterium]|jgi:predicted site-specific integrase-resolvase